MQSVSDYIKVLSCQSTDPGRHLLLLLLEQSTRVPTVTSLDHQGEANLPLPTSVTIFLTRTSVLPPVSPVLEETSGTQAYLRLPSCVLPALTLLSAGANFLPLTD